MPSKKINAPFYGADRAEYRPFSRLVKLTPDDVLDIRSRYKERVVTLADLAKEYDVHLNCIWKIVAGKTWRWLLLPENQRKWELNKVPQE